MGTEPAGLRHGEGAVDTKGTGLVGSGTDHTARADTTDDDRPAAQFGTVALFHGGIEGIHIHVQNSHRGVGHVGTFTLGSRLLCFYGNRRRSHWHVAEDQPPCLWTIKAQYNR